MPLSFKKRDLILIAVAILILAFLWQAPPESTSRVPYDETHLRYHELVKSDGKKAAERFCEECHNADIVPFPAEHPRKARCLFCHKLGSP
jgi:cytochrome c5